jgi:hypothetical protein
MDKSPERVKEFLDIIDFVQEMFSPQTIERFLALNPPASWQASLAIHRASYSHGK